MERIYDEISSYHDILVPYECFRLSKVEGQRVHRYRA
jgi:hypothetical protein